MRCIYLLSVVLLIACGDDSSGIDAGLGDSSVDTGRVDASVDASDVPDATADASDASLDARADDVGMCFAFATSCGAVAEPVCCEGICGPAHRHCCSETDGRCDPTEVAWVNDGCCAGFECNADSETCEIRECFPSVVPGADGPACAGPGETAPCCDAGYECTEDEIFEAWCCAPDGMTIPAERASECCSGSMEILGDDVRCIPNP